MKSQAVLLTYQGIKSRKQWLKSAYARCGVTLWGVPPKSPDLNPVEQFWAFLRRRLRMRDLADLKAKRKPLSKTAYKARVRAVCRTAKAQQVAKSCSRSLRKTCLEVIAKQGAASKA